MAWVFMDLEMKPVDKQFRRQRDVCRQEVIEFGAVKLGEDLSEIDSFRRLVKPVYGDIPPRYERLTGISNADVAEAPDFETVLPQLHGPELDDLLPTDVPLPPELLVHRLHLQIHKHPRHGLLPRFYSFASYRQPLSVRSAGAKPQAVKQRMEAVFQSYISFTPSRS